MKNLLSHKVLDIKPSGIRKFFDIVSEMKDAVSLGVGEPDFDTPWHIRDEGIYALTQGRTHYTSNKGMPELREEISRYLKRRFQVCYSADDIIVTVGGSEAIDLAMRAMLNPGDEVIVPEPCYVSYTPCVRLAGGTPVPIHLKNENNFKLTADELKQAVTDKTKILILAFPNNPTGAIMQKEDLEEIAKICIERDIYVLTDEIYAELTYKDEHFSIAALDGMVERTIYINGFSKAYAMTGWRLGYVAAPTEIMEQMLKIHQYAIMCAPTNSQSAAIEALRNGDMDVYRMKQEYDARRRLILNEFQEMGLPCFEPYGAFYAFPYIGTFNMSSEEFATRLLQEQKLAIVPGTAFGDSGEGFVRISYAYSLNDIKIAMERLRNFILSLK